jgi:hypothetical protein
MAGLCWFVFAVVAATPAELLTGFRPSAVRTDYGKVSEVEFSTGMVELEPGALAHHLPHAMKDFHFAEPVWLIGYSTSVLDAQGRIPTENYLCHTFFADQRVMQRQDDELRGIYSDAFTPEVRLPEGFGIPLSPNDPLHWMPMFNNRGEHSVRVRMKVVLALIRSSDIAKPLKPLYASLRSVQVPHLFFVPPGRDERQITFDLPFNGRIHFLGTHLHPYGASIELYNVSRQESVWKGVRQGGPESSMNVYSDGEGYPVRAGDKFRVTAVYQNPTRGKIDAMAGLFMLYSRD